MQLVLIDGVTKEEVRDRILEHPKWNWMMWEMEWQRTQTDVDFCVAMSLMQEVM